MFGATLTLKDADAVYVLPGLSVVDDSVNVFIVNVDGHVVGWTYVIVSLDDALITGSDAEANKLGIKNKHRSTYLFFSF